MANTAPTVRPVVFVGSSSEGLELAKIIQVLLDANNDVELWTQGVFGLSHGTLESLVDAIPHFDFAVLVLTADDLLLSRGTETQTARDNVLLELGLFMGGLGRDRTFIIHDRVNPPKLPSDLAGITPATFRRHASGNLKTSLGAPCTEIEQAIKLRGVRTERLTTPMLKIDCTGAPGRIGGANNPARQDIYMKFRVQNTHPGTVARNCRAYLIGIHEVRDAEVMAENLNPDSVQLTWEGGDFEPRDIPSAHPDGTHSQYEDIVHFSKREGDAGWLFHTKLPIGRKDFQGVYQFRILVSGENVAPVTGVINIEYWGNWKKARPYAMRDSIARRDFSEKRLCDNTRYRLCVGKELPARVLRKVENGCRRHRRNCDRRLLWGAIKQPQDPQPIGYVILDGRGRQVARGYKRDVQPQ